MKPQDPSTTISAAECIEIVLSNTGVTIDQLFSYSQARKPSFARQMICYILRVHAGYKPDEVAQHVMRENTRCSWESYRSVKKGKLDERARQFLPGCRDAKHYAQIMYDRRDSVVLEQDCDHSDDQPSEILNPRVLIELVIENTKVSRGDIFGRSLNKTALFAQKILAYTFIKHADYTRAGASQCLMRSCRKYSQVAVEDVVSGMFDDLARMCLPECTDAKDYARIMYERALATPLPKHRRAMIEEAA